MVVIVLLPQPLSGLHGNLSTRRGHLSDSPRQSTPACPRCGYDQAGEVARWETMCPLQGKCSECGLDFEWRLVMRPELQVPRWFIETAEVGSRRWAAVGTAWRSILPWIFWRKVRMEYPIVLRYALAVSLIIFIACYLLMVAVSQLTLQLNFGATRWGAILEYLPVSGFWLPFSDNEDWIFYTPYSTSTAANSWKITSIDQVLSATDLLVLLSAFLMPLTFRLLPVTLRRCKVRKEHLVRIALYSTPWVLLWAGPLMRFVGWALLKVNWTFGIRGPGFDLYWISGMFSDRTAAMVVPVCALWLFVVWGFACSRYLRLPTAWAVAAAMVIICTLTSVLLVLLLYPMAYKHLFSGLV